MQKQNKMLTFIQLSWPIIIAIQLIMINPVKIIQAILISLLIIIIQGTIYFVKFKSIKKASFLIISIILCWIFLQLFVVDPKPIWLIKFFNYFSYFSFVIFLFNIFSFTISFYIAQREGFITGISTFFTAFALILLWYFYLINCTVAGGFKEYGNLFMLGLTLVIGISINFLGGYFFIEKKILGEGKLTTKNRELSTPLVIAAGIDVSKSDASKI